MIQIAWRRINAGCFQFGCHIFFQEMHLFYLPIIGMFKKPQFFCHLTDAAWLPYQKNKKWKYCLALYGIISNSKAINFIDFYSPKIALLERTY